MKNIRKGCLAVLIAASAALYSCGPNDSKGSMDTKNSGGEGAVDSTRLTNFDSTSTMASDSSEIK